MPLCHRCGVVAATVEMRRSPKVPGRWMCKDKDSCKHRRKKALAPLDKPAA